MKKTVIAATILLAAVACDKNEKSVQPSTAAAAPAPAVQAQAPAPASANALTGKVLETFDGGGYTYLRIATSSGEQWAAVREVKVAKGDTVTVDAQMTMENFESKTLNRTFDRIVFGSMAEGGAPAAKPIQMPPMMSASPQQHMQPPAAGDVKVEKVSGGRTVAEVWAGKKSLDGKEVVVRGKVVKFLGGIMGRNWMHIQDGTGSAEQGDNDLTVTTDAKVSVGDVVTVKGTVAADKDFGAGYRYEVIVEGAKLQ